MIVPDHIVPGEGLWGGRLFIFQELLSTNQWMSSNRHFYGNGDAVWALRQSAGRGRMSRRWLAAGDRGLTISFFLTMQLPGSNRITLQAALAVRRMLSGFGIDSRLKWPNDVMVKSKKIAGIIAEGHKNPPAVVLGIGINVNLDEKNLKELGLGGASSMRLHAGIPFSMDEVRKSLQAELGRILREEREVPEVWMHEWKKYDWLEGARIEIDNAGKCFTGDYRGVDPDGRLLVSGDGGCMQSFSAGSVEILQRPQDAMIK